MNCISRDASTLDEDSRRDQPGAPNPSPAMDQDAVAGIQALMNFLTDSLPSMLEAFVRDIHVPDREEKPMHPDPKPDRPEIRHM